MSYRRTPITIQMFKINIINDININDIHLMHRIYSISTKNLIIPTSNDIQLIKTLRLCLSIGMSEVEDLKNYEHYLINRYPKYYNFSIGNNLGPIDYEDNYKFKFIRKLIHNLTMNQLQLTNIIFELNCFFRC